MNFMDFIAKLEISGSTEYSPDKDKEKITNESTFCKEREKYLEKYSRINRDALKNICTESLKAEKKCECKCKNQQDFNKKLIKEINEFRIYLMKKMQSLNEVDTFLCNIEERLCTEIGKSDTEI